MLQSGHLLRSARQPSLVLLLSLALAGGKADCSPSGQGSDVDVQGFLNQYCVRCHNPEVAQAGQQLDQLDLEPADDLGLLNLQDVTDQLILGFMPPRKAERQPEDREKAEVIEALNAAIEQGYQRLESTGGQTVLRRLNRREYRRTLRDLLGLDLTIFDPARPFPEERREEHLDNVGDALITSGYLLDRYLEAADLAVEKALGLEDQPPSRSWVFEAPFGQQPEIDDIRRERHGQAYLQILERPQSPDPIGAYGPLLAFEQGVPYDGCYQIRVLAEAKHRHYPYERSFVGIDPEQPFILGVVPGDRTLGELHRAQAHEPLLASWTVTDDQPTWLEAVIRLEAGISPRLTFENGPSGGRLKHIKIGKELKAKNPEKYKRFFLQVSVADSQLPQIHVHQIHLRGPIYPSWPPASQAEILGDPDQTITPQRTREILSRFADRAYRRPATDAQVDRLVAVAAARLRAGRDPRGAVLDAIKAALCSPAFLYLDESPGDTGRLDDHDLASRLSYFLWASMPDDRLRSLADAGRLDEPEILTSTVDRMLDDPRSEGLLEGFLNAWLTLDQLGSAPPDRKLFSAYYADNLESAMRTETHLFLRHMLEHNRPIEEFLDGDLVIINEALARLYDIPDVVGEQFRPVRVTDRRRGGLLGQASVLTVTANGVDTSPVVRGVWVLENLLGTPPPPPPADVEPLDPDLRGTTTIRNQLETHRSNPACYECHRKIDPLGFALESFDPIGRWRTRYPNRAEVETAGELPDGQRFEGIVELKDLLLQRREIFTRALTVKLLSYALGRRLEATDRPEVDRIVGQLHQSQGGFRDLVHLIVNSPTFGSP